MIIYTLGFVLILPYSPTLALSWEFVKWLFGVLLILNAKTWSGEYIERDDE